MKKIGFVGLGHMGQPMAMNLVKAGFEVTVYDLVESAVQTAVKAGARAANRLAEVAKEADVIFTMLQTGEQVKAVCQGIHGLFQNARPEVLFIDCSSIEMVTTLALHDEADKQGVFMVDAPVSGGVAGAEAATLTIMVGGTERNYLRAKPILEKIGKKIIHAGDAGHGQAAKICNNLILGISMIAVSEGFNLADKLGLDAKKFFEISSNASGQCWSMTSYCPVPGIVETAPSSHQYQAGFMTKMMLKDLRLAQHAAEQAGANLPLATEAAELYSLFESQGHSETDFSGIIRFLAGKST